MEDCKFIHMDQKGMGLRPPKQQEDLLKRRIRTLRGPKWSWSKIRSFRTESGYIQLTVRRWPRCYALGELSYKQG